MRILQGCKRTYSLKLTGRTFITYLDRVGKDLVEDLKGIDSVGMAKLLNLLFSLNYSADKTLNYDEFMDSDDVIEDIMNVEFVEKMVKITTDLFSQYQGKDKGK